MSNTDSWNPRSVLGRAIRKSLESSPSDEPITAQAVQWRLKNEHNTLTHIQPISAHLVKARVHGFLSKSNRNTWHRTGSVFLPKPCKLSVVGAAAALCIPTADATALGKALLTELDRLRSENAALTELAEDYDALASENRTLRERIAELTERLNGL